MRILFYINAIHQGGAERVMVNLAKQFAEKGDEVCLVTSLHENWEYPVSEHVRRISFEEKGYVKEGFVKQNIQWIKKLRKVTREINPDVIISFMAEPNFRTILATWGLKCKTIISVRGEPIQEYPNKVYRMLAKSLYLFASGVVFQTEDAQKWFSGRIQKKSEIIYNQVDEKFYNCAINEERKDIVTCGRLVELKNQKMLIDAFARISDEVAADLYIYGEGHLRAALESQVKRLNLEKRVFLPGDITAVEKMLSKAALFVLPSDSEGMPNALMEAMAVGVPCISTDCPCGGPRMLFQGDEEGLIPVGDVDALAEKLREFVLDKNRCKEQGEKMKAYALEFTPERIFKKWDDYVNAVVKSK